MIKANAALPPTRPDSIHRHRGTLLVQSVATTLTIAEIYYFNFENTLGYLTPAGWHQWDPDADNNKFLISVRC